MNQLVILHQGAIGDFLLALSIIQSVRDALHATNVLAIANSPVAAVAAGKSAIDQWLSPEAVSLHTLFGDGRLNSQISGLLANAGLVLSFLSGPKHSIDRRLRETTAGRVISIDPRPTADTLANHRHITTQWSADIREQGLQADGPGLARIRLGEFRKSPSNRPRTLIHPGAGGLAKCWPLDRFMALADSLAPAAVHWMLGPAELDADAARFAPIRRRSSARDEPLLVEDDLHRAAEHIAGMDLYIGNDTGMTHLAAALGIPTIAIFGPTDPAVWRPLGEHVTIRVEQWDHIEKST